MNKSQIFTNAHTTAKILRNKKSISGNCKYTSYKLALSIALKAEYVKSKSPFNWDLLDSERFLKALEAIANGGKFNGTVYTKKVNKNWWSISIYVNGELFTERVYNGTEKEAKAELQANINSLSVSDKNELVNTGLGYSVSRKDLHLANQYGYDGIEMI